MAELGLVHAKPHDSGSESTALLSSGSSSRDRSVLDSHGPFRFNSSNEETCNYGSISVLQKQHLLPLMNDRLSYSAASSLPTKLDCKHFYEIHSPNLILRDDVLNENIGIEKKKILRELFPKSLSNQIHIKDIAEDTKPKQSSLVTIFSIWNTILGSSLLTMPWGIQMAGFVPAIICILTMSGLCLFTAYKLLQVHKYFGKNNEIEVTELSRFFLGSWAEYMAKISSMSVLLGANIAYWILMSNFLYNSVNFLYVEIMDIPVQTFNKTSESILCPKENFNETMNCESLDNNLGPIWDLYKTVPIFLALIVFPVLNFNTTTFFTKFNSFGTIAIIYLVLFVLIKSISWGINMDKLVQDDIWILRPTFPVLSGMLSLSFFIHNIIITIMQSNRNQKKNGRDLTIAYVLVTITYVIVGFVFYICFPLTKECIEDNLLNNFQINDGLTVGARIVLLFQLFTVYPLLAYMLRIQLLSSIFKTTKCRQSLTLFVNFVIVTICIIFAIFLPHIGNIVRYTGAISGLVYVFTLPTLLYLMISHRQGTMTILKVLCYICIPIIGILNFISQFFIKIV